ncbi:MAG: NAD(P)H-hydrate dehydratase [Cryobacterium sp.]|nr:NAD(P)H-hydrate dehydratase [Cryobacterium sp.]
MSDRFLEWGAEEAAVWIAIPKEWDDKYSRGVLGVVTGSEDYPGAAVIGVDAALRTGVGMLRYLGSESVSRMVLERRPEAVTVDGKVQAWLIGSGMTDLSADSLTAARVQTAIESGLPAVLDAAALSVARDWVGPAVLTPHEGELAKLLGKDRAELRLDPGEWAVRAASTFESTVVLKGHTTWISGPGGDFKVTAPTTWLATAGAGDALAGIMGALVATHSAELESIESKLSALAATAVLIHGKAAFRASRGGPFTMLDLNQAIPDAIREILGLN